MKLTNVTSKGVVLLHVVFWIGYAILRYASAQYYGLSERLIWTTTIAELATVPIITYANLYLFLPKFFDRGKVSLYILCVLFMIGLLLVIRIKIQIVNGGDPIRISYLTRLIPFMAFYFLSTTIWLWNKSIQASRREIELQHSQLEAELKFLKLQLSPHFLFNTLNNIYSLAYLKNDNAAPAIIKLSDMMRHMIYDSQDTFIPLSKEIDFITSFIDLHKLKLENKTLIAFDYSGVGHGYDVAPMIFLVFLENAFKHGDPEKGKINIKLDVNESGILHFNIFNKITHLPSSLDVRSGVGLSNVKKRLNLIYPGKYTLVCHNTDDAYEVNLTIQLT